MPHLWDGPCGPWPISESIFGKMKRGSELMGALPGRSHDFMFGFYRMR